MTPAPNDLTHAPKVSVILVNYNAESWLPRCLESLRTQSIFREIEVLLVDNSSSDLSVPVAEQIFAGWPGNGRTIATGGNYGFAGGANRGVAAASGRYVFLLNPDTWFESACLEELHEHCERVRAGAAGALVMDYDDEVIQARGDIGFDFCGNSVPAPEGCYPDKMFCAGNFYFIRRDLFEKLGGLDDTFFMYGEEMDLTWRLQMAGEMIVPVLSARLHHRGAAEANPAGGTRIVEFRTSERKRFFSNRNNLLILLKNSQHLLLLLLLPNLVVMLVEAVAGTLMTRKLSYFRAAFIQPISSLWSLRKHIAEARRNVRKLRGHGDLWMCRWFTWRFGRWADVQRLFRLGAPIVDQNKVRPVANRPSI